MLQEADGGKLGEAALCVRMPVRGTVNQKITEQVWGRCLRYIQCKAELISLDLPKCKGKLANRVLNAK